MRRARVHPAAAIDLRLFENRTVALANAATVAYAVGFFAMLLANVLFLTTVWEYSTLKAGLAITPGPLVVAALSRSTGALAGRIGYRPVLVVGSLVFATAQLWCVALMPLSPDYLGRWLPASLLTGLGVALTFPVLSAAAVAGLPAERFGVGGALNQTARQMGARARRRPAGVDPRHADVAGGGARRLPERVAHVRGSGRCWRPLISSRQRRVAAVTPAPEPVALAVEPVTA